MSCIVIYINKNKQIEQVYFLIIVICNPNLTSQHYLKMNPYFIKAII
ncbi:Hypothetical protein PAU_00104 [Photorhabdus asymbiotica]|uniref:Uncharacterized protein n=1 Tax=Photorhabdus asymbiotica subsp. asymbiotica (strain ATCC 43949 / 3105-77) TaxID=553480 RepID=C7BU47_PHOAA|nr:Hypothetical protein PAU_00104 [Photorhabdus asymbiotica]